MTTFHGCHSPYEASMAAYHHPHYSSLATEDRLEAALAKLDVVTRCLDAQLDALLLRLPRRPRPLPRTPLPPPPFPTPQPLTPSPPPPLKPTLSPMLTAFTTVPPPPATTPPPPPPPAMTPPPPPSALIQLQPITSPRPTILPAPHAKQEEHRAIALFELGPGFFGSIMVSRKCRPTVLALRAGAELSEFCRHRPWDPGITLIVMVERITLRAREMESSNVKNKSSGKRKMSSEDTRSYFTWNLEMECVLADVLRDQINLGNKGDGNWKAIAYSTVAQILSKRFGVHLMADNVKNRFKLWRTWYGIVSDILSQSEFDWDSTKYMITVENQIAWNEYVKSHEEAKRFRFKVIPNWDDIVDLCAKDRATGLGVENALDVDDIMSKETNEEEAIHSVSFDLEGSSSAIRKYIRPSKSGEKEGMISLMK
ncbi:hypothetical protein HKD37_07G020231 [Glycine soja]